MFTIDEKEILITSLITKRNVIETDNPYISANSAIRWKELRGISRTGVIEPRALSVTDLEDIIKINRLITKIQTAL